MWATPLITSPTGLNSSYIDKEDGWEKWHKARNGQITCAFGFDWNPSPMAEISAAKWEGRVSEALTVASADQIWPMLKDFFNFHKWFPTLANCYGHSGTNGEVGCVRFCSGFSIPSAGDSDGVVSWSKERLVAVDDERRRICYEIVDSNIGFKSYVAAIEVAEGGDGGGGGVIEWSFAVEPVEGLKREDLVKKYEMGLRSMAKRMETALQKQLTN